MKEWYRRIKRRRGAKIAPGGGDAPPGDHPLAHDQTPATLPVQAAMSKTTVEHECGVVRRRTEMRFLRHSKGVQGEKNKKAAGVLRPRQPRVLDAPLTWRSLVGLLASRARLRFTKQKIIARGEENERRDGCIGPSSSEEEALAAQGQPEQPSGPADSAGVALIEAACVRETVEPEYSVSGLRGPGRLPNTGRRIHEGMDMGCSRTRKERLDNLAKQDRDNRIPDHPASG